MMGNERRMWRKMEEQEKLKRKKGVRNEDGIWSEKERT
jgi:hypothetical protein